MNLPLNTNGNPHQQLLNCLNSPTEQSAVIQFSSNTTNVIIFTTR